MAKMYPSRLTDEVRNDPSINGEVTFYDCLAKNLSDEWVVLYRFKWVATPDPKYFAREGETDFVVAHPEHGILVIEVKGGTLDYDPQEEKWTQTSKTGHLEEINDPFAQAATSCRALSQRLSRTYGKRKLNIFYAVCFPNSRVESGDLPAFSQRDIIYDVSDLDQIEAKIIKTNEYWLNKRDIYGPPTSEVMTTLVNLWSASLHTTTDLAAQIIEHRIEFERLSEEQKIIVEMVGNNNRLLVSGCAGSGKTYLACRMAERYAKSGKQVLVLCFNDLLGQQLAEDLTPVDVIGKSFHEACADILGEDLLDGQTSEYYEQLPIRAQVKVKDDPTFRFDAILIDEAQDFQPSWWNLVKTLLRLPDSTLCVFTDANQFLYFNHENQVPTQLGPFFKLNLIENRRNTQQIHQVSVPFYSGDQELQSIGPQGPQPEWIEAEGEDQYERLAELIKTLKEKQHVELCDIVVLTPHGLSRTQLATRPKIGRYRLYEYGVPNSAGVRWSTVRRFKGLESPIVILVEFDDLITESSSFRGLAYVGMTRAQDALYVIATRKAMSDLQTES